MSSTAVSHPGETVGASPWNLLLAVKRSRSGGVSGSGVASSASWTSQTP